jgi:hypothetical protein
MAGKHEKDADWGVTQAVEHLPSKHKALSSNPSTGKKIKVQHYYSFGKCKLKTSMKNHYTPVQMAKTYKTEHTKYHPSNVKQGTLKKCQLCIHSRKKLNIHPPYI